MRHDVFISHASEDKELVVRELALLLQAKGLAVWYDEHSLKVGDSLVESIGNGLAASTFGIVVISPHFLKKQWPKRELAALVAREDGGGKVVLPIWHDVSREDIVSHLPLLADRVALNTNAGLSSVVDRIFSVVAPERIADTTYAEAHDREAAGDFKAARAGYMATLRLDENHASALAALIRLELPDRRWKVAPKILLGQVKWYKSHKGFGFIEAEDGKQFFVHVAAIERSGLRSLEVGQPVAFLVAEHRGKVAIASIRALGLAPSASDTQA